MMAAQIQLQDYPPSHHHHSSSPHDIESLYATPPPTTTSSSPQDIESFYTTHTGGSPQPSPPPPDTRTPITAFHYSLLVNNDQNEMLDQLRNTTDISDLFWELDNSTILHLAATEGQLEFIQFILTQNSGLLFVPNCRGDLPIHAAVRACQFNAVEKLLSSTTDAATLLMSKNLDNNTALHIALENHQEDMANFLFRKCPNTFYYLNLKNISPLYLAIKAHFWDLVKKMLSDKFATHFPDAEITLLAGKSVVHAVILAKKKGILELMNNASNRLLLVKRDEVGRTPLSYAAYIGFHEGVKYIINTNIFQSFVSDKNGYFPIHWACIGGNVEIVKEFFPRLLESPETTRLTLTKKAQNILHVAAECGKADVVKYILQHPELDTMINMKDEDGNTPLHLASKAKHPRVVYAFTWNQKVKLTLQNNKELTALDIIAEDCGDHIPSFEERLTWLALIYAGVPRAPQVHHIHIDMTEPYVGTPSNRVRTNCEANTTCYMAPDEQGNNLVTKFPIKKGKYKDRINTLLVVATLVATVTFASGFSIPGGYNDNMPDEGMATLAHKLAFQVFVISNTIAMYSAILAAVTLIWAQLDELKLILLSLELALPLLGLALAMMSVAFMSGLYVVLHTVVFWLGLVALVMGLGFLGALLVFFIPLCSPRCITNKILRNIFHLPFLIMLFACEKGKSAKHY